MKTSAFKIRLMLLLCLAANMTVLSQVPQGFNYQAVARTGDGEIIPNEKLKVRIAILTVVEPPAVVYEAEYNPTTNEYGLFQLVVGDPLAVPITGLFSDVDWSVQPLYLRTLVYWNSKWQDMGSAQLLSVPYALVSHSVSGLKKLSVSGATTNMNEALFAVKNNVGDTVFAVYNEGVRVGVGDGNAKGLKGGFAIGGFGAKGNGQEYFRVTSDSTRIFVKDAAKGSTKGGFAIGGFSGITKAATGNYMDISPKNYFIGHESGSKINGGLHNSVLGFQAARSLTTGSSNTILGTFSGYSATGGNNNILVGEAAGYYLSSGNHNTLIGSSAGYNHTNQQYNVMIGTSSGSNINSSGDAGSYNSFIGINSGYQIRASRDNVFLGTNAGYWLDNGRGNTFVGIDAGRSMGEGGPWPYRPGVVADYNIFVGYRAGYNITNGDNNLAIGYEAGYSNADGGGNVFIGYQAGKFETGSGKLYIANSGTNPPLIYGDFSSKKIGINTITLNKTLNVGGDAEVTGNINAASLSATGNISAVSVSATGNFNGNLTGNVNGMSVGKIFLDANGTIISTAGGSIELYLDLSNNFIKIINNNANECQYWFKIQRGSVSEGNTGVAPGKGEITVLYGPVRVELAGYEFHFGLVDQTTGWCSVWLQYFKDSLVGHYIKY